MAMKLTKIHKQLHNKLLANPRTIAAAESCTGGLLSSLLTEIPGSSQYFILGVVAYSNGSKQKILDIPVKIIAKYGAVSGQVAKLMAKNIRIKIGSDFGLSITGIAGPTGAAAGKPVGTVFICLSAKDKNICRRFFFRGTRKQIRQKAASYALRLLCARL